MTERSSARHAARRVAPVLVGSVLLVLVVGAQAWLFGLPTGGALLAGLVGFAGGVALLSRRAL